MGLKESRGRILVVDDDIDCCALMVDILTEEGYEVHPYLSGDKALEALKRRDFDLILSDIKMPGITGIELLLHVRRMGLDTEVILVTAYASLQTALQALRGQAFDYLTKPFAINKFRQRVSQAMEARLSGPPDYAVMHYRDLSIDRNAHRAWIDDQEIKLTRLEFDVLAYLFKRQGCAVSPTELLEEVWGQEERTGDTVKTCIRRLRKKIEDNAQNPRYIVNIWGVGYQLGE
jgi:DNA-binding response OmpR family regulator